MLANSIVFAQKPIDFITLDPGHFHAALVQNKMYENVNSNVSVYAPSGQDLQDHLKRIDSYNVRSNNPTKWQEKVYEGNDFFEKMLIENKGATAKNSVLILAGNNKKKTEYILKAAESGLNILADNPMCIDSKGYELLKKAFVTSI